MFAGLYTLMTITVPPAVRSRSPTIGIWRGLPLRDRNVCARRVDAVLADASAVRVDLEVQVAPAGALLAADLTDWLPIVTAWLRPIHASRCTATAFFDAATADAGSHSGH